MRHYLLANLLVAALALCAGCADTELLEAPALTPIETLASLPTATVTPSATPAPVRVISAHPAETYVRLAWSADGQLLGTSGNDLTVKLWNANTLELVQELSAPDVAFARFTSFSPSGRWLMLSEGWHGKPVAGGGVPVYFDVGIWDLQTGQRVVRLTDKAAVWQVVWAPGQDLMAYWDSFPGSTVQFWAAPDSGLTVPDPVTIPGFEVGDARWLADGSLVFAGVAGDTGIGVWRSTAPDQIQSIAPGRFTSAYRLTLSADGTLLAVLDQEAALTVWDVATGEQLQEWRATELYRLASAGLAFSPDQALLATATDREVLVWDIASGGLVARLMGAESGIYQVTFSPDGTVVAAGENDGNVRLWRLGGYAQPPATLTPVATQTPALAFEQTPDVLTTLTPPPVESTPVSPAGTSPIRQLFGLNWPDEEHLELRGQLLSNDAPPGRWIVEYGVTTGRLVTAQEYGNIPSEAVLSPDSSHFALWLRQNPDDFDDDTVAVYTVEPNALVFELPADSIGVGNEIAWSPDSAHIAVQTFAAIEVFDARTGEHVHTLENVIEYGEGEGYAGVVWSPNGTWIASFLTVYQIGSRVAVWSAETGRLTQHLFEPANSPVFFEYGLVERLAWAPDGNRLLMVRPGRPEVLDVSSGQVQRMSVGDRTLIIRQGSGAWSPDGNQIAFDAQQLDGAPPILVAWNILTNESSLLMEQAPNDATAQVATLAWASGHSWLAAIAPDGRILVIDADTRSVLALSATNNGETTALAWSPSGQRLAAGNFDGHVTIWEFPAPGS